VETASSHFAEENPLRQTYLWIFISGYTLVFFISNWFDPRLISLFGLDTAAGSLAFPFTYLISDIITEVYGYKHARRAVWTALLFFLIFILYDQWVVTFLIVDSSHDIITFLLVNNRILLASTFSYLVTESINSYIVAKLKIGLKGKYMGIRFIGSTLTAYTLNELIYAPIAFYNLIPSFMNFVHHMLTSWGFMVTLELLLLPFSIRLAKRLKIIENLDIYDTKTNFNPFSLNTDYQNKKNEL
jgi:queuosine precursor transporter